MKSSSVLLCSPSSVFDRYDYDTRTVELGFDPSEFIPKMWQPTAESWKYSLRILHEYAHFYQFATTSYGFLISLLGFCKTALIHGFLVALKATEAKKRRPVIRQDSQHTFNPGHPADCALAMLEEVIRLRSQLFGQTQAPTITEFTNSRETGQSVALGLFLRNSIGFRKMMFYSETDYIHPRCRIEDVLESHAQALSTVWLVNILRRTRASDHLIGEVLAYGQEMARGPYRQYVDLNASKDPVWDLWSYCTFCDLALNPPIVNYETGLPSLDTALLLTDSNWNPTYRLWQVFLAIAEHKALPKHGALGDLGWEKPYIQALLRQNGLGASFLADYSTSASFLDVLEKHCCNMMNNREVPDMSALVWLDSLGSYKNIWRLRTIAPLVLSGSLTHFEALLGAVGAPNLVSDVAPQYFRRPYMGLCVLGLSTRGEMEEESEAIFKQSVREHLAMEYLLHGSREESGFNATYRLQCNELLGSFVSRYGLERQQFE